jgi:hypothetical protein
MYPRRLYPSISLLSLSIVAFQLALMQILSLIQWNHFAYLVISIALLGFGASGTLLSLLRNWFISHSSIMVPLLMLMSGLFMGLTVFFTREFLSEFDSYLLFNQPGQIRILLLACLLYMLPFLFGGGAIGLIYTIHSGEIGKLYFADLAGSGLGGAIFTAWLWFIFPVYIIYIIAFFPLISAILAAGKSKRKIISGLVTMAAVIILIFSFENKELPVSEFKSLQKALNMQGSEILIEKSSPYGHLHAVNAPALRYAPGLSLAWENPLPASIALFNNGNWFGAIPKGPAGENYTYLDYTFYALPFVVSSPSSVLILEAGTGNLASYSLLKGSHPVTMVEANAGALGLMKNELAGFNDSLLFQTELRLKQINPRSYLLSDTLQYDLIYFPEAGTFGGTSGMAAAEENYLFTTDAFIDAWHRLNDDGYIMVTAWMDYPSRVPLRLLSIITGTLKAAGVHHYEKHLVIIRSWGNVGFLIKKSGFEKHETDKLMEFCHSAYFDPMLMGGFLLQWKEQYNYLQDENLSNHIHSILKKDSEDFFSAFDFNISPPTDDRPFFYRFIKPARINNLLSTYSIQELTYMEPGYFIIFMVFFVIITLALVLIFLPMLFYRLKGRAISFALLYFGGLGIGFMFVEIVLIQLFILYLGEPIYSAAAVLSGILLFSGAGSYFSGRLKAERKSLIFSLANIILLIVIYAFVLRYILINTVHMGMFMKIIISMCLIAPPSFFMGMAFPLGIRILSILNETLIPWAWGINGYLSVVSAVLAIIISIHTGFTIVILLAALAYLLALFASLMPVLRNR